MTKYTLALIIIFSSCIYGMETNFLLERTKSFFNITYLGTQINVTKESLFDISNKVTMIVLGQNEQNRFENKFNIKYKSYNFLKK